MKKNLTHRAFPVLCLVAALVLGCGGSDDPKPQSCDSDADKYSAALSAYISDPSVAKCNAFKDAADDLLDCPGLTAGERKEYEDAVDGIVCD
ncbi:MAG TPA: hypothetical protein VK589_04735 [Chryseolinea sp.]|nr:hypothetical protein [Chryseolinea sp.]